MRTIGTAQQPVGRLSMSVLASMLVGMMLLMYAAFDANAASVTRGPYLQTGTPTSMTIRWRTDTPCDSLVRYGPAPGDLPNLFGNATLVTEHELSVTNLTPASKYYYSIGTVSNLLAGNDADHFFYVSPTHGSPGPTRIWVVGDSGTADANAVAVRDAYYSDTGTNYTHLFLMLGDNAYQSGTDPQYQAAVFDMYPSILRQTPLWSTFGNHDGYSAVSSSQTGPYYDLFTFPTNAQAGGIASGTEAYYSFDYANVHLTCLNSYDVARGTNDAMAVWLNADANATTQEWRVAYWHHPPYTKGSHDSDIETQLVQMRGNILPMLEQAGVDLVLSGHSHSYERSAHLHGYYGLSGSLDTNTMVIDGGDGRINGDGAYNRNSRTGTVYVVAGSSGKTSGGSLDHAGMFVSTNVLGSLILNIVSNRLDARFLGVATQALDEFTIVHDFGDMDKDRMSDSWEQTHFGTTSRDGSDDYDADGSSDGGEYQADTNPTNTTSALEILGCTLTAGQITINWRGGQNAYQFLERKLDLTDPNEQWLPLLTNSWPTPVTNQFMDSGATNQQRYFYRIKARRSL